MLDVHIMKMWIEEDPKYVNETSMAESKTYTQAAFIIVGSISFRSSKYNQDPVAPYQRLNK